MVFLAILTSIKLLASSPYVSFEDNDRRDIENVIRTLSQAEQVGLDFYYSLILEIIGKVCRKKIEDQ